jgi:hypothetical protein
MEKLVNYLENLISNQIPDFIFGVRVQGEPVKSPTFKTSYPENQPSQFDWFQQFRVSSLHNVNQAVFLEAK